MRRFIALTLVVFSPLVSTAADPKIGDMVFLKPEAEATIGGAKVEIKSIWVPAPVVQLNGESLFLGKAWVDKKSVMTADEALEYYSKQIGLDSTNSIAYANRGKVRQTKRDLDGAIEDFNEAIRLDPKSAAAFEYRGAFLGVKSELYAAIKDAPQRSKPIPLRKPAKSDLDVGINDLTEAIKLDPERVTAYQIRGAFLAMKDDLDSAIKDLSEALKLDPKNTEASKALKQVLEMQDRRSQN